MAEPADRRQHEQPWLAHEHPERPLDRAAFVCGFKACSLAIAAATEMGQSFKFVVRGRRSRRVVTAAQLTLALTVGRGFADLLHGDEVRDVGVASAG
jgi:hypothetical protein